MPFTTCGALDAATASWPFAVWARDAPATDNRPAKATPSGKYFKIDWVTMNFFMMYFLLNQFKGILRSAT